MEKRHYLLRIEYLGFRYHGWQKQPAVKTVQHMLDRTLVFILEHDKFKTLGASRTDSMVSATDAAVSLTIRQEIDCDWLYKALNRNLPADIRCLSVEAQDEPFSVISSPKEKTYHYFFSNEQRPWPFSAPYMCNFLEPLDIGLMKKGAKLFEGHHDFKAYCYRPSPEKQFERTIELSEVSANDVLTASFFPENSYVYTVKGEGFMRHQIRLMMGALLRLGKGEISISDLEVSLKPGAEPIGFIAPASGLMLGRISFLSNEK